ncbi:MAG: hypothetical protein AB7O49_19165 [Sphingomonadales bacterium]
MLSVMALLFALDRDLYYAVIVWWGFSPTPEPFWDTYGVLAALDCHRAGVNVWQSNACMNGGFYTYSPFLLHAAALPVHGDMAVRAGLALTALFLLSLAVLPGGRNWKETAIRCLALLSTACAFAVERGNLDLVLYAMATGGVWLLLRPGPRWLGYGAFVLAALLKFYPVTLLVLAARERPRTASITALAASATLILFVALSAGDMRDALAVTPIGWPFGDVFGALNLPFGVFVVPNLPAGGEIGPEVFRAPLSWQAWTILAVLLAFAGYVAASHLRRDRAAWRGLDAGRAAWLAAGAAVIVGCFFAAQNVAYRAIFLLLTLPGLYALMAGDRTGLGRYRSVIVAVLFVLWQELFHRLVARVTADSAPGASLLLIYWAIRELVWWWLIARLASLLAAFLLESPALARLTGIIDRLAPPAGPK